MMGNPYDQENFFQRYAQMPRSQGGLAAAGEWQQLRELFPPLQGKRVLDLGCGYGWHCRYAVEQGATQVLGIDISERMLAMARQRNGDPRITYAVCAIQDYAYPEASWDCVISNLALHYLEDLAAVYRLVHRTLAPGGYFVMNIEHPVFTAGVGQDWVYNAQGEPLYWPVDRYFDPGERVTNFLGCRVTKQHHTLTQILNGLLANGFALEAVEEAKMALSGDEDRDGALSLLDQAQGALEGGARLSEDLSALAESVAELRYAADDVAERVRDLREQLDFAPGELDELESRLDVLYRLKRKYGPSAAEMLEYLDRSRKELDEIQFSDEALQKLEKAEAKALKEAKTLAKALSAQRRKAAEALKERIRKELAQLDMPKVRFETEFGKVPGDLGLDGDGMDKVQFLMSANVGENLKPIQKVASGGELARIMLALKNVLAENEHITTLIFDEVDAGVSGRAAQKVAEKMAQLAQKTQVLCVTHLPQLAAMSDHHFSVRKGERQGRTYTQVELLDRPARRQELARLTGGAHVSQTILEGAEELLAAAEAYKQTVS